MPHVPFNIGGHVGGKPGSRRHLAVIKRGIAAGEKHDIGIWNQFTGPAQLGKRKRQQFDKGAPARQRLGYAGHQPELLGAGQDKETHPAIGINDGLQVGEKFRAALNLVEHPAIGKAFQKRTGIFQRGIRAVGKDSLGKGRFAGLTRPGQGDDRKAAQQGTDGLLTIPWNHTMTYLYSMQFVKAFYSLHKILRDMGDVPNL